MCHSGCFEAGRFTQTQSSRTDPTRSRKWMSGPAGSAQTTARDTLTQPLTGRKRQIVALFVRPKPALRKTHPSSAGGSVFFLDKSLSWMSRCSSRSSSAEPGKQYPVSGQMLWLVQFPVFVHVKDVLRR
jgi:hypothetical protein